MKAYMPAYPQSYSSLSHYTQSEMEGSPSITEDGFLKS